MAHFTAAPTYQKANHYAPDTDATKQIAFGKDGNCPYHPDILLRKTKSFPNRGWKILLKECPACARERNLRLKREEEEHEVKMEKARKDLDGFGVGDGRMEKKKDERDDGKSFSSFIASAGGNFGTASSGSVRTTSAGAASASASGSFGKKSKEFTMEEVAKHNKESDCWVVIGNDSNGGPKVYDITSYLDDHPGGTEILLDVSGQNADEYFEDIAHSDYARDVLKKYLIGTLKLS